MRTPLRKFRSHGCDQCGPDRGNIKAGKRHLFARHMPRHWTAKCQIVLPGDTMPLALFCTQAPSHHRARIGADAAAATYWSISFGRLQLHHAIDSVISAALMYYTAGVVPISSVQRGPTSQHLDLLQRHVTLTRTRTSNCTVTKGIIKDFGI